MDQSLERMCMLLPSLFTLCCHKLTPSTPVIMHPEIKQTCSGSYIYQALELISSIGQRTRRKTKIHPFQGTYILVEIKRIYKQIVLVINCVRKKSQDNIIESDLRVDNTQMGPHGRPFWADDISVQTHKKRRNYSLKHQMKKVLKQRETTRTKPYRMLEQPREASSVRSLKTLLTLQSTNNSKPVKVLYDSSKFL